MLVYETDGNYSLLRFNSLAKQCNYNFSYDLPPGHLCKNLRSPFVLLCLQNLLEYYLVYHFLYIAFFDRASQKQFTKLITILLVTPSVISKADNPFFFCKFQVIFFFLEAILKTIQMNIKSVKVQKLGFDYVSGKYWKKRKINK